MWPGLDLTRIANSLGISFYQKPGGGVSHVQQSAHLRIQVEVAKGMITEDGNKAQAISTKATVCQVIDASSYRVCNFGEPGNELRITNSRVIKKMKDLRMIVIDMRDELGGSSPAQETCSPKSGRH